MFKQNVLIFFRLLRKYPALSFVSIAALVLGFSCWLITWVYFQDERSYDNYHRDLDRLYRVAETFKMESGDRSFARIAQPVGPVLKQNFPEVQYAARIMNNPARPIMVKFKQKAFPETGVIPVEPDLLRILTIPFVQGDPATALEQPGTVALTKSMAVKYFGAKNPMGQTIIIFNRPMKITAVLADAPVNTHLPYQFIVSLKGFPFNTSQWFQTDAYTYIKLAPGVDASAFAKKITHLTRRFGPADAGKITVVHFLQPIKDIHLSSKLQDEASPPGNLSYLRIALLLGFLTLAIATLNFANLLIARSSTRTREIGVRKAIGAQRSELKRQFVVEALASALVSLALAMLIVASALPLVNSMLAKKYLLSQVLSPGTLAAALAVALFAGIAAGAYPALILSRLAPGPLIKKDRTPVSGKARLHKVLLTLQFVISTIFVIGSLMIARQLHFMKSQPLGFANTQKMVLPVRNWSSIRTQADMVKKEFSNHSAVRGAAFSSDIPGREMGTFGTRLEKNDWDKAGECFYAFIDCDFLGQYQIKMAAGRPFQRDLGTDRDGTCVINQAAARALGFASASAALDHVIIGGNDMNKMRIIGVAADFHYEGLHTEIKPLVMELLDSPFAKAFSTPNYLTLTVDTRQAKAVVTFLQERWRKMSPQHPFDYFFLDDDFNRQYAQDERTGLLTGTMTAIGIAIACSGLFGMMVFASQRRRKELSIRKIVGASTWQVAGQLNREFICLLLGANALAWPLAYWAVDSWLHGFAYHVSISPLIFIASALIMLLSGLVTVGMQTFKTARTNPVESLRYE